MVANWMMQTSFSLCQVVRIDATRGNHDIVVGEIVGAGISSQGEAGDTLTLPDLGWSYAG